MGVRQLEKVAGYENQPEPVPQLAARVLTHVQTLTQVRERVWAQAHEGAQAQPHAETRAGAYK